MSQVETRSDLTDFSLAERDRRWQLARGFLRERGLDCLVVAGLLGSQPLGQYLRNEPPGGVVILPREGEPVYLSPMVTQIIAGSSEAKDGGWIRDVRPGARGTPIAIVLKEMGCERGRVGVVGLLGEVATDWEGWIPYRTWQRVLQAVPDCKFEDVTAQFAELMLVKSGEELRFVQRAAEILEQASQAMVATVRPGVSEREVYAAIRDVLDSEGAHADMLNLESGWGLQSQPIWLWQPVPPRVLREGDIVVAEIFAWVGGLETQVQVTVAIPPVAAETRECALLARMAYEEGLRQLRPGKTFGEVCAAMEAQLGRYGIWHGYPLIHSLNPHFCIGKTGVNLMYLKGLEQKYPGVGTGRVRGEHLVLKPGMTFELEPNACKGRHRVNIGGTAVVTENGPQELNRFPTTMRVVGE